MNYYHFTPKPGRKSVHICKNWGIRPDHRHHEWIELYQGEAIIAHESHREFLERSGLQVSRGQKVYRTMKGARKAKNNINIKPTE